MTPRPSILATLGVVTATGLAEQVVLTRLFSAVLPYHFGFLAISLAMLGTGAAALLLYVRPSWGRDEDTADFVARWAAVLALTLVLVPIAIANLDLAGVPFGPALALRLGVACVIGSLPAFAAGVVVASVIARHSASIGIVYAVDLVGASLGAVGVIPLLALAPAPVLLVFLAAFTAAAGFLVARPGSVVRYASAVLVAGSLVLAGIGDRTPLIYLDPGYNLPPGTRLVAEHWTPLGRHLGFLEPAFRHHAFLFYDRVYAPIPAVGNGAVPDQRELHTGPASIGFALAGPGSTLIIGGGGGRDIYNALSSGQRRVDVIELLDGNRRIVNDDLGAYSGSPYSRPGVHTTIGDGRSVLASGRERYDQIHIGFTDTLSANAAQGFALNENGLYTVEAFDQYFDHLKPFGILNVSRALKLVGDEALRATVLTLAALERRGVADPFRHVVVVLGVDILGPPTGTVLARLEPFTDAEIERIKRLAAERAEGLLMVPGGPNQREWKDLAAAPSLDAFCNGYHLDVCAPTDDRPFFFDMGRLGNLGALGSGGYIYDTSPISILLLAILLLSGLSAVGLGIPLAMAARSARPTFGTLLFFASLGVGYLLLEIALMQRFSLFLGFPTYALSVVLFALLLFSGVGALSSARYAPHPRGLALVLGATALLIAASAFALPPLLAALAGLSLLLRAVVTVVIIAPFGLCAGAAMPLGLGRLATKRAGGVPYAWGVNGIASVLASALGTFIAVKLGFAVLTLVASAAYGVALVVHRELTRAAPQG